MEDQEHLGETQAFQFPSWSRTLEQWSDLFSEAGFLITRLYEPRPSPEQVTQVPELDDCFRIAYFLIFDLRPGRP